MRQLEKAIPPSKSSLKPEKRLNLQRSLADPVHSFNVSPTAPIADSLLDPGDARLPPARGFGHDFSKISIFASPSQPQMRETNPSLFPLRTSSIGSTLIQRSIAAESVTFPEVENGAGEDIGQRIQSGRGNGSALPTHVRHPLEGQLDTDLSQVRIHTDSEAARLARSVGALAFTTGQDIFFGEGRYNSASTLGMRLLTHEVVHTVQQASGPVSGTAISDSMSMSDPSDSFELEADRITDQVMHSDTYDQSKGSLFPREEYAYSHANTEIPKTSVARPLSKTAIQRSPHPQDTGDIHLQLEEEVPASPTSRAREKASTSKLPVSKSAPTEKRNIEGRKPQNILLEYGLKFLGRLGLWKSAASSIGIAYDEAKTNYDKALADRAEEQQLSTVIALGILSAVTLGSLSWISSRYSVKIADEVRKAIAEAIEDSFQEGVSQALTSYLPQKLQAEANPTGETPLTFYLTFSKPIEDAIAETNIMMSDYMIGFDHLTAKELKAFSPEKFEAKLKTFEAQKPYLREPPKLPEKKVMVETFEKSLWAEWISRNLVITQRMVVARGGLISHVSEYDKPGRAVEKEFHAVGIDKASGIGTFSWSYTSESDIRLLLAWAEKWKRELQGGEHSFSPK